jgi:hypothetical protein
MDRLRRFDHFAAHIQADGEVDNRSARHRPAARFYRTMVS